MEKVSRVQEIKKRFEGLTFPNNESSSDKNHLKINDSTLVSKIVNNCLESEPQPCVKSVIKRSHAFRDKSKIKPFSSNEAVYDKDSVNGVGVTSRSEKPHIQELNNRIKLVNINHLQSSSSNLDNKKPSTLEKPLRNVKPLGKTYAFSDTIKKALNNPLPTGPAPKKPPRTFAHFGGSSLKKTSARSEVGKKVKLIESEQSIENENFVPSSKFAPPRRSKTEPHIMLKKLESALLANQRSKVPATVSKVNSCKTLEHKRSLPESVSPSKIHTLCINGFSSCISKNIYDTPLERGSAYFVNFKPISEDKQPLTTTHRLYGSVRKIKNSSHIYEEPYSPRSERKFNIAGKENLKQSNSNSFSNRPSLHYMSSPIVSSEREAVEDQVNANGLKARFDVPPSPESNIKMITDIFNDNTRSDSDADSSQEDKNSVTGTNEEVAAVRKVYAKRVSSMRQPCVAPPRQGQHLFEALLLVGLDQDPYQGKVPYIKTIYPQSVEGCVPESLPQLVFPDADDWPPQPSLLLKQHNNYTLTLTAEDGARKYAYCRRLQPEGTSAPIPLAYVILTPHRDNTFFYRVLSELEGQHGQPEEQSLRLFRDLYHTSLPKPGSALQVGEIHVKRAADPRQEDTDIARLLQAVTVPVFIKLFSTLLIERKVILVGSNISTVSDCIEGLQKALFPFEWEHTLIGAVPSSMLELCTAPTPYLMGVVRPKLSPHSSTFLPLSSIDHCVVADLDSGQMVKYCGDEGSLLPHRLSSCLKSALYLCPVHGSDVGPSEAIIRLFVELVGHYRAYVITDVHTNKRTFQREPFVKAPSSRNVQLFLDWFTETAMFQSFIQKRLDRSFEPGLFEQRCAEYIAENVKNHNAVKKEKTLNKTVKIIGDRFKDWTSSS